MSHDACYAHVRMSRSLHVRLDAESEAALALIRGAYGTDSDAVRWALRDAARRATARSALAAEAARVVADEQDRARMRALVVDLEEIGAPLPPD